MRLQLLLPLTVGHSMVELLGYLYATNRSVAANVLQVNYRKLVSKGNARLHFRPTDVE